MKKIHILFVLAAISLLGCSLESVKDWGNNCPADGNGRLTYIVKESCTASTPEECDGNFRKEFEFNRCPKEYPICEKNSDDPEDTDYHCEPKKKVVKECAVGQFWCGDDTNGECVDPSSISTCGASEDKCDALNHGGVNCEEFSEQSRCEINNLSDSPKNTYICKCANGFLMCNDKCINPNDTETCGASNCDAENNYGGNNCEELGDAYCQKGKCQCLGTNVMCRIEGEDKPRCVDPMDNATCNATKIDGSEDECTYTVCNDNELCRKAKDSDEYSCKLNTCQTGELNCPVNGEVTCVSETDFDNCGSCKFSCSTSKWLNASADGCKYNEANDDINCTFACLEGYTNCEANKNEFMPDCVDLKIDDKHCGICEKECSKGEACQDGSCVPTSCTEQQCTQYNTATGTYDCLNDNDEKCGKSCQPCKNKHDNATCQNGECYISQCKSNEHPIYETSSLKIIRCDQNSTTACAPFDLKSDGKVINCETDGKIANAAAMKCTEAGVCLADSCIPGYHLSRDGKSCVLNSDTACAAVDSANSVNCNDIIANTAKTDCAAGECKVVACNADFHISADSKQCLTNTDASCGAVNSKEPVNCNQTIANSAATKCENGVCKVTNCKANNHPSSDGTKCLANSADACAPTNISTTKDCKSVIPKSDTVACTSGECTVSKCAAGYHLAQDQKSCVANTAALCAPQNSPTPQNCTSIANSASTKCDAGVCIVNACKTDYHLSGDKKSCVANTAASCAPQDSPTPQNCTSIANSASTKCVAGVCIVNACKTDYHLSGDKKSCVKNTATACGKTDTNITKNCSSSPATVCVKGECKCSADGSTILNASGKYCVHPACKNIPGVKIADAKTGVTKKNYYNNTLSDYACNPSACESNYQLEAQGTGHVCKPLDTKFDCTKMGYNVKESSADVCLGCANGYNSKCGNYYCKPGYKYYIMACLPIDSCCGTTNTDMSSATDFRCYNCAAQGKTCNTKTGNCQ